MLSDFLNGTSPDHRGRYLRDIWDFDDKAIEHTHDFIQWMFPLKERSGSVPGVPTLSAKDIDAIHGSDVARANLERSVQWYLGFLQRNDYWVKPYDHNHLRITRVIKALDLLLSQRVALTFLNSVLEVVGESVDSVSQAAIRFWKAAISFTLNVLLEY